MVITLVTLVIAVLFLPTPWSWIAVVVAALVDIVETVTFLWWSRRRRSVVGVATLVGRRAVVVTMLAPRGQVRVQGEIWEAESPVHVEPGREVVVCAARDLVLHVEPAAPSG